MKQKSKCGKCDGCLQEDCGKCPICLDMPKFGGVGKTYKYKQCKNRICENPVIKDISLPKAKPKCEFCGKEFNYTALLDRHTRSVHLGMISHKMSLITIFGHKHKNLIKNFS